MKIDDRRASARMCLALAALTTVIAVAGCGGSSSSTGSAAASSATAAASSSVSGASTAQCGAKPGAKATGTPINLGAIVTKQAGTDFTDAPNAAKAYFDCVNANGGINGHPIQYFIETEQTQPAQIEAALNKLVNSDHVVGMVGSMSILECTVNHTTWEKLGFYEIGAGVAPECNSTPNSTTINMGPRYSSDGAVQYALSQHVSKILFDNPQLPNIGYIVQGVKAVAQAAHVPVTVETDEPADPGRELDRPTGCQRGGTGRCRHP